ncbi:hypothetical protein EV194_11636 [Natronoflexus pectinivorans]|uniref:Uncharacterized protein n=1 Tax=Natronoflexus pectinivorans TaxID=682526 RepID=A0A4V2RVS1_9BACT|nr:hypothetical protein EV194_11636 [Natronoflexus pectinivorans]
MQSFKSLISKIGLSLKKRLNIIYFKYIIILLFSSFNFTISCFPIVGVVMLISFAKSTSFSLMNKR